jgi:hypothetical protein
MNINKKPYYSCETYIDKLIRLKKSEKDRKEVMESMGEAMAFASVMNFTNMNNGKKSRK